MTQNIRFSYSTKVLKSYLWPALQHMTSVSATVKEAIWTLPSDALKCKALVSFSGESNSFCLFLKKKLSDQSSGSLKSSLIDPSNNTPIETWQALKWGLQTLCQESKIRSWFQHDRLAHALSAANSLPLEDRGVGVNMGTYVCISNWKANFSFQIL